jgi:creatinine amidohydrolase
MTHDKQSFSEMRRRFLRRAALAPFLLLAAVPAIGQKKNQTPVRFERVTGYRIQDEVRRAPLAILPLGSVEYHGPSGPAGTDSLIATGLAERLAARLGASLFPTIHYTHCPAHTAVFTGSLSIRPETITAYFLDVLQGVVATGFQKVLVLNGHDGNIGPARLAVSQTAQNHKSAAILLVSWWETLPGSLVDSLRLFDTPNGGHGHGGPLELSVAAAFAPDSVEPARGPDLPAISVISDDFPYYLEKSQGRNWPGYSGKLSEISAAKGERLTTIALERLEKLVRRWMDDPDAPGSW